MTGALTGLVGAHTTLEGKDTRVAAETETMKIKIDDVEYDIPALDDMDMDEWQIIYDYSGLVLEDFAPAADRADEHVDSDEDGPLEKERQRRIGTPSFTTALLHIGYRRVHPDAKPDAIKRLVGATKRLQVLEAMAGAASAEGDALPPESTPELAPQSPPESGVSSEEGSNGSQESSGQQGAPLDRIGTAG